MLSRILDAFSSTLYIQIWRERLRVLQVESKARFDDTPFAAISRPPDGVAQILEIGKSADRYRGKKDIYVVNPFLHPRQLVGDFQLAEKVLQHAVKEVFKKSSIRPAPRAIVRPMELVDGGLSEIESRALRELAVSAGCRDVVIHVGEELIGKRLDFDNISPIEEGVPLQWLDQQ